MSDQRIMDILLEIHGDIGQLKGTTTAFAAGLAKHVADDEAMAADIKQLQLTQASNKGAARVWTLVGSGIGAALGSAVAVAAAWLGKH